MAVDYWLVTCGKCSDWERRVDVVRGEVDAAKTEAVSLGRAHSEIRHADEYEFRVRGVRSTA